MKLTLDKSSWKLVKLADVVRWYQKDIPNDKQIDFGIQYYVTANHIDGDSIKFNRFSELIDGQKGPTITKHFKKGDLLLSTRSVALRKAALAPVSGVTGEKLLVLRPKDDSKLLKDIFPFIFQSIDFWEFAQNSASGSVNKFTSWTKIREYKFFLPPKDQQAQLAELLWAMDEVVAEHEKLENAIKILRDSIFQQFCNKSGKEKEIKVKNLIIDGPKNGFSPKSNLQGEGFKTVSIGAIKNGEFNPENNIKFAQVDESILLKFGIEKGDIFVVRGNGNKNLCGKAGISKKHYSEMFYPDLLIRLRFDSNKIIPTFATYQWNHPLTHARLLRSAKSTNGIWKINGKDIKRHTLFVPDLDLQKEIMAQMDQISSQIALASKTRKNAYCLQKSLINQIF